MIVSAVSSNEEMRGVWVSAGTKADFPSKTGLDSNQLQQEIEEIVSSVSEAGCNTIFFETIHLSETFYASSVFPVSPLLKGSQDAQSPSFDALAALIESAEAHEIKVYAVLDLARACKSTVKTDNISAPSIFLDKTFGYTPPALREMQGFYQEKTSTAPLYELEEYHYCGNDGFDYYSIESSKVQQRLLDAVREISEYPGLAGICICTDFFSKTPVKDICFADGVDYAYEDHQAQSADAFLQKVKGEIAEKTDDLAICGYGDNPLSSSDIFDFVISNAGIASDDVLLKTFTKDAGSFSVPMVAKIGVPMADKRFGDPYQLNYRILLGRNLGCSGHIFASFSELMAYGAEAIGDLYRTTEAETDLSYSNEFAVTRPQNNITYNGKSYFIMGTSDPNYSVYLNWQKIESGEGGTFGALIDLKPGKNTFTVSQNGQNITRTITVPAESNEIAKISTITQSSMIPGASNAIAFAGEEVTLQCIAPAGSSVNAIFEGNTVELEQVAEAEKGVPAVFRATATLAGDYPNGRVTVSQDVIYVLDGPEGISEHTANGHFYIAGKDAVHAVRVSEDMGNVFLEPNGADFHTTLRRGSLDYALEQENGYLLLSCGGYIPMSQVELLAGRISIENRIYRTQYSTVGNCETLLLTGTHSPAFTVERDETQITVTLFNAQMRCAAPPFDSSLFSNLEIKQKEDRVVIVGTFAADKSLWGYYVSYRDNAVCIEFYDHPKCSNNTQLPLDGINIVLDPGHGGYDPGALGPTGADGPTESDMNLAQAKAIQKELEALGATVYLTRTDDYFLSLDERVGFAQMIRCDLFIAVHYNSAGESKDTSQTEGVEAYYYYAFGKSLAQKIVDQVSAHTGRPARGAYWDYFRVTRLAFCPAILMETGFMPNPAEYEKMLENEQIVATAKAVAQAVLQELS